MIRPALAALTLSTALVLPAHAEMSEPERQEFRAEVRSYLLENPEVLMEAIAVLEKRQAQAETMNDQQLLINNAQALFNDENSWVGGNPEGDITVVEFMDYKCGYCKRAHPEVSELLARDGNIRLIVKEFPILGDQSLTASQFAIATRRIAGDEAYGEMKDALMTMRGDVTTESLRALADDAGLDTDAIITEMSDPEITQIIQANRALGQRLNINGTPSFVFGDQMVRGYVPLENMEEIVAALREES
ncbi:DsbA family protein [Oceaniglobus ichthyenteri]|uniref:DsbA family protein n=1 Tax=Oceaniglobus ichthyenteri TaxID=2136177 RepID=UPI000D3C3108|nr:DsbA family protein [Oceaniglobus ichthyenteri]